jgi:hypothetical protein
MDIVEKEKYTINFQKDDMSLIIDIEKIKKSKSIVDIFINI